MKLLRNDNCNSGADLQSEFNRLGWSHGVKSKATIKRFVAVDNHISHESAARKSAKISESNARSVQPTIKSGLINHSVLAARAKRNNLVSTIGLFVAFIGVLYGSFAYVTYDAHTVNAAPATHTAVVSAH